MLWLHVCIQGKSCLCITEQHEEHSDSKSGVQTAKALREIKCARRREIEAQMSLESKTHSS